jgi:anaerobic magnesium-protoporphyrin IX monomethyl ester cyclase
VSPGVFRLEAVMPESDTALFKAERLLRRQKRPHSALWWRYGQELEQRGWFDAAEQAHRVAFSHSRQEARDVLRLAQFYLRQDLTVSAAQVLNEWLPGHPVTQTVQAQVRVRPVSVYINAFQTEAFIAGALESMLAQSYPILELLVIDDAGTDRSRAIAEEFQRRDPRIRILDHGGARKGLGASRNTALYAARGEFLATIDTDDLADRFWLERLMRHFALDNVAGAGGKAIELYSATLVDRWRQLYMSQHHGDRMTFPDYLAGNNTVFRVDALRAVNGYNPRLMTNYEDHDLSIRLRRAGYHFVYDPRARVWHRRHDTLASILRNSWKWNEFQAHSHGDYESLEKLHRRLMATVAAGVDRINYTLREKRAHLVFIEYAWLITRSLNDLGQYLADHGLEETFGATADDVMGALRRLWAEQGGWRPDTAAAAVDAMRPALIFDQRRHAQRPPLAVRDVVHRWFDAVGEVVKDPVLWTMLRVSWERIAREQATPEAAGRCDVVLVNAPWREAGRVGVRAGSRWPFTVKSEQRVPHYVPFPFWMAYATAVLKQAGYRAHMIDAVAEGLTEEECLERVRGLNPRLVFIETAAPSFHCDVGYARQIKSMLPDAQVAMGGPVVNAYGTELAETVWPVDFFIRGEYEWALAALANSVIRGQAELSAVPGLIYRTGDGAVWANPPQPVDIRALPWPERESLPIYNYQDLFAGMEFPMASLMASRGCPYACDFCVWIHSYYNDHRYRVRDPQDVAQEARWLVETFGMRSLYFDDDTFNIGRRRIQALCQAWADAGVQVKWGLMGRADGSDLNTLAMMRQAGLVSVKFGVESGNQDLVNNLGKQLDLSDVSRAVKACRELGIFVHLTFTLGVTGETAETLEQTFAYARELQPDSIQFSINTPFPGTPAYRSAERKGLLRTQRWHQFDGANTAVADHENLDRDQLQAALERAYREFLRSPTPQLLS